MNCQPRYGILPAYDAGKSLAKAEKENKDLYLQDFLECRQTFTPMVYSADVMPGSEALSTKNIGRTTQLQTEAGILLNVWLCEGEDVNSNSEV